MSARELPCLRGKMQEALSLWIVAGGLIVLAVIAGLADYRRNKRANLDAVGFVPWPFLQFAALMGALIVASLALHQS